MSKTHKRQHTIPESYQELFADPTAQRRKPHVWVISTDGSQKSLRPPSNTFVEHEIYTINLPSGERELIVERTLAEIEGAFMDVYREKISKHAPLVEADRVALSLFAAAMLVRPGGVKRHWESQIDEMRDKVRALERHHGLNEGTSTAYRAASAWRRVAHQQVIAMALDLWGSAIFQMRHTLLVAPSGAWFISSDAPAVLFNPRLQGTFYAPGTPLDPDGEVLLALSPSVAFLGTWKLREGYLAVTKAHVDECNRFTWGHAHQFMIAPSPHLDPYWLVDDPRPPALAL